LVRVVTDLAVRATISAVVATFEATAQVVRSSFAALDEAELALARTLGESDRVPLTGSNNRWSSSYAQPAVERALREARRHVWGSLVKKLDMRRFMSVAEWEAFDHQLRNDEPPPVSLDFIHDFMRRLVANMPKMHERAVLEVFDWLRPRSEVSRSHKTNEVFQIGKKVVLPREVKPYASGRFGMTLHYSDQKLLALENVFCVLDGAAKGESWRPELALAIEASSSSTGETRWFRFKCYQNGNLHLEFTRPDLVARINQIGGARSLKAAS